MVLENYRSTLQDSKTSPDWLHRVLLSFSGKVRSGSKSTMFTSEHSLAQKITTSGKQSAFSGTSENLSHFVYCYLEISIVMGVPQNAGWFLLGKMMMTGGYPHDYGNPHLKVCTLC